MSYDAGGFGPASPPPSGYPPQGYPPGYRRPGYPRPAITRRPVTHRRGTGVTPRRLLPPPGYAPPPPMPPALKPGVIPLRPLSVSDIFNGAVAYIRANPKATLGLTTVVVVAAQIVALILQVGPLAVTGQLGQSLRGEETSTAAISGRRRRALPAASPQLCPRSC